MNARLALLALCLTAACGDDSSGGGGSNRDDAGTIDSGSGGGTIDGGSDSARATPDSSSGGDASNGGDAGTMHGASSGIAGEKLLLDLNASELSVVCRWYADEEFLSYTSEAECLPQAVFKSTTQAECESQRDGCVSEHPAITAMRRQTMLDGCGVAMIGTDCMATVGEFEACMRDGFSNARAYAAMLSCSNPMPTNVDPSFTTESCTNVTGACIP